MTDDRDFSWLGKSAPEPPAFRDTHFLWALELRGHRVEARVRQHPIGPEFRLTLDGELLMTHVYPNIAELEAGADKKLADFEAKGWQRPGPVEV